MFGRIFTYLFFLMVAADIYIFMLFIRKYTRNIFLRILWFLPTILLAIIYFLLDLRGDSRDILMIVYIAIAVPKIFFAVISLLDLPLRYFFKWKVYPFTVLALFISIGMEYVIIYGGIFGTTHFKVREVEFLSPNLPASFDGYKIIQVSDIHLNGWADNKPGIERLVEIINRQNPDVVMVTGDLVHHSATELDGFETTLSSIKTRDGVYSVLGNHDYGPYRRWENKEAESENLQDLKQRQADMGWQLLNNGHTFLTKVNDTIALIGVENDGAPPFAKHGDLDKAMKGTEHYPFKILLSHDPTHWRREVLSTDIDLMLAGHTHASQFRLGNFSFASFVYSEWGGMYREENQGLYINPGIGHVGLPFRFGAWPEITVIVLKKE